MSLCIVISAELQRFPIQCRTFDLEIKPHVPELGTFAVFDIHCGNIMKHDELY